MAYRYYLKARAPSPGAQPKGFIEMQDYGFKKIIAIGGKAWGYVDYKEKLTQKQVEDYELVYGGISE